MRRVAPKGSRVFRDVPDQGLARAVRHFAAAVFKAAARGEDIGAKAEMFESLHDMGPDRTQCVFCNLPAGVSHFVTGEEEVEDWGGKGETGAQDCDSRGGMSVPPDGSKALIAAQARADRAFFAPRVAELRPAALIWTARRVPSRPSERRAEEGKPRLPGSLRRPFLARRSGGQRGP